MAGIQGYHDTQLGTGGGGGTPYTGWINLGGLAEMATAFGGAPTADPSAQWVGGVTGTGGIQVTVDNTVAVSTVTAGISFTLGTMAAIFPGLPAAGAMLEFRYTRAVDAPNSSELWFGFAMGPATPITGTAIGDVYRNVVTTHRAGIVTGSTFFASGANTDTVFRWQDLWSLGGTIHSLGAQGETDSTIYTANATATYLFFVCGCASATGTGPHTASGLWEMRAVA